MVSKKLVLLGVLSHDSVVESNSQKAWRVKKHAVHAARAKSFKHYKRTFDDNNAKRLEDDENVVILQWWSDNPEQHPYMSKSSNSCGGCYFTNDRSMEKTADGLLIDNTRFLSQKSGLERLEKLGRDINWYKETPPQNADRPENQYWIFWPREAASKGIDRGMLKMRQDNWDSAFNLTTSYRIDSDIPRPFGNLQKSLADARYYHLDHVDPVTSNVSKEWIERETGEENIKSVIDQKAEAGQGNHTVWMVSNCDATRGAVVRQEYVKRLVDNGLKLDGFGECFDNVLVDSPWTTQTRSGFHWGLFAKYKFYLAFENSIHCNGYISEKMWRNSLAQGLVPVIYGPHPDDVKAQAPPNSYIHVEDFETPQALTAYLDYLDTNTTAYAEYHDWRKMDLLPEEPVWSAAESMKCGVCNEIKRRKKAGFPKRTISSVSNWWWVNVHDEECVAGSTLQDWATEMTTVTMKNQYDEG